MANRYRHAGNVCAAVSPLASTSFYHLSYKGLALFITGFICHQSRALCSPGQLLLEVSMSRYKQWGGAQSLSLLLNAAQVSPDISSTTAAGLFKSKPSGPPMKQAFITVSILSFLEFLCIFCICTFWSVKCHKR